jgi:hypothetical protein
MFTKKGRIFNAFLKRHSNRKKLSVYLDGEDFIRFKRLRKKLMTLDDSQILSLSLKMMEKATDKIIAVHHMNKKGRRKMKEIEKVANKKGLGRRQSSQI